MSEPRRAELRVEGMDCASCAATIERAVKELDGIDAVQVDVIGGRVRVDYSQSERRLEEITRSIRSVGFTVRDDVANGAGDGEAEARTFWQRQGRLFTAAVSGVFLSLGLAGDWFGAEDALVIGVLAISSISGAWFIAPRGVRAALNRALDMNFLMTLAAAGAWIIGEQAEAAATLLLFAVAELLESYSMDRARSAIRALMAVSPFEARVRRGVSEVMIPVSDVNIGETVIVRPGEKIPVDGLVTAGRSSVNQAPITGESMPVDKEAGLDVFAGSLNVQGMLEIKSTKRASDTTLARIIHAVEEAQASRAPSQRLVDRFARIYTPSVVAIAVLIAIMPPLLASADWGTWIYRSLTMLVVACPCALVISTPVSIVSGLAGAAREGILIKGGVHLEHLGAIRILALDKTGTLTEGKPSVTDVVAFGNFSDPELLRLVSGVERHSEHPLARALLDHAKNLGISAPESHEFEALIGRGARAMVGDKLMYVGNSALVSEIGITDEEAAAAMTRFENEGKTSVTVVIGDSGALRVAGVIAIADRPRPGAAEAISELHRTGVRDVVMLTGDNQGTAQAIAKELGIDRAHAGLLPDDKVRIVRELEANGGMVAFVGDGVNDAPALAAATVGIAMGAAGTDVALETADVALMGDDLSRLAVAVRISRKTHAIIRQNIAFSLLIKAVFLVLAVGGFATLWMAVAADMGGSLLVVANGLRARGVSNL